MSPPEPCSKFTSGVVGSYDPGSLLVNFGVVNTPELDESTTDEQLLALVPHGTLVHEFYHFLHAFGTIAGISDYLRCFDGYIRVVGTVDLAIIQDHGVLNAPVTRRFVTREAAAGLDPRPLLNVLDLAMVNSGGYVLGLEPDGAPRPGWLLTEWAGPWGLRGNFGAGFVPTARIGRNGEHPRRIVLGYRHVAEGAARAIELLCTSGVDYIPRWPTGNDTLPDVFDPYWVAYFVYRERLSAGRKKHRRPASLLEFVLLADLSMMISHGAMRSDLLKETPAPEWLQGYLERPGVNTMTVMIDLADRMREAGRSETGLADSSSAHEFQNAALRSLFGPNASVDQLNNTAIDYMQAALKYREEVPLRSSAFYSAFRNVSAAILDDRREYFDGGNPLSVLLGAPEEVRALFLSLVPFFTIGEYGFQTNNPRYGDMKSDVMPIEDLLLVQWDRDVYEGLLFGGKRQCPLDAGPHRLCGVERQALCQGIQHREGSTPCRRQYAVDRVMANPKYGGNLQVRWTEDSMH